MNGNPDGIMSRRYGASEGTIDVSLDSESFIWRPYEVSCKYGIHARPAALLVKLMGNVGGEGRMRRFGETSHVDLKSIMGLMTIEGHKGAKFHVGYKGDSPKEFYSELEALEDEGQKILTYRG